MAHTRYVLDKQGYTRMQTATRPGTLTHAQTHKHVILIGFANALQCYAIRTLHVLSQCGLTYFYTVLFWTMLRQLSIWACLEIRTQDKMGTYR